MLQKLLHPSGLALGRTAVGVIMLTTPALIPSQLGVEQQSATSMTWAMQMLGAREVALGLGALTSRQDRRRWLAGGVLCDAVDAVAVLTAMRRGRVRKVSGGGLVAVAVAATFIGLRSLRSA